MKQPFYTRYGTLILLVSVFLLPFAVLGTARAIKTNKNDVKQWLPETYEETQIYRQFRQRFEGEEFILVTWEGCTLNDPRLELLCNKLVPPLGVSRGSDQPAMFSKVITGKSVLEILTHEPLNLPPEEALKRLTGSLIGADGEQTCAVLTLTMTGKQNLRKTVNSLRDIATNECSIPRDDLHMGGPPVDNVAIDEAGESSLVRLALMSGLIGIFISWRCLKSPRLVAMVIAVGVYTMLLSLAIVWYSGTPLNAILLSMPSLVYVTATSGAIHLANYYRDYVREHGVTQDAPEHALAHAALPLSLATGTTAVGLLSLVYSELVPIKLFGIYSAIGVVVSVVLLFLFLPACLHFFPLKLGSKSLEADAEMSSDSWLYKFWLACGQWIIRRHVFVATACLLIMGICGWGMTKLETSVQLMRLFSPDARILADYKWIEDHIGELVPMEIVVQIDPQKCKLDFLERMRLVKSIEDHVAEMPEVGSALAVTTFAPNLDPPKSKSGGAFGSFVPKRQRAHVEHEGRNKRLVAHRDEFLAGDYFREIEGMELFRVSARVGALKDVDYAHFINEIKATVAPLLDAEKAKGVDGIEVTYTGLVPLVYKAQHSMLDGLIIGFVMDMILIVAVMTLLLRRVSGGMVLLLTGAFPALMVFGIMGWAGILVDVGTVMTPAVALGVTVDDIVHFMLWYRRGIAKGDSRPQSVMLAYHACARPIFQSWGVIGLGLAVFILSPFTPTQRFGYIMVTMLTAALAGNLILMPALLAGPLGWLFARKIYRPAQKSMPASEKSTTVPAQLAHRRRRDAEESVLRTYD